MKTVKYNGTVLTAAGFRSVEIEAIAKKISEKRCIVKEVIKIDGEEVKANMSRTGFNRQRFYVICAARREEGKTKNISTLQIID